VESGARTLKALNPDVNVIALPTRIDVDNAMDVIADYDVVIGEDLICEVPPAQLNA
jgi:molybdopterin/thiamine biosynthesis adenylyltransferase